MTQLKSRMGAQLKFWQRDSISFTLEEPSSSVVKVLNLRAFMVCLSEGEEGKTFCLLQTLKLERPCISIFEKGPKGAR